jgi:hypothetical protein
MISRVVLGGALAVVMLLAGTTTYVYLGTKTSKVAVAPQKPTAATPRAQALRLPGTLYLTQSGALYSLAAGRFHQLTAESGWTQPALYPDGSRLLIVKWTRSYSDVYIMSRFGKVQKKLTANTAPARSLDTGANHWSFYPRLGRDGRVYMAYDQPKFGYDVVMSIWAMPLTGNIRQGKLWSNADDYTGGDVQPIPLRQGGIIYTKYSYGPDIRLIGQLWYLQQPFVRGRPSTYGRALTNPGEDCRSPVLSPNGTQIAMICTYEKQVSYLVLASWNGKTLGPRKRIVTSQMVAQPTWAPDGSGIAYLAPAVGAGQFQLWFLPKGAYTAPVSASPSSGDEPLPTPTPLAPVKPIQLTTNNGFDATSPMAWAA